MMGAIESIRKVMSWKDYAVLLQLIVSFACIVTLLRFLVVFFFNPAGYIEVYEHSQIISGVEIAYLSAALVITVYFLVSMLKEKLTKLWEVRRE